MKTKEEIEEKIKEIKEYKGQFCYDINEEEAVRESMIEMLEWVLKESENQTFLQD